MGIMADNIYLSHPVKLLGVKRHTDSEYSFEIDYKLKNEPGRYVMVSLPGIGEVPISISGFSDRGIELTIRNAGKITGALFKSKIGAIWHVRGPYGTTFPVEQYLHGHLLVVAGGSGVAAVKALIEYFHKPQKCALRQLDIMVGFRSKRDILFYDTLKSWAVWAKHCKVLLTVDKHENELDAWEGKIGFVMNYIEDVENLNEHTRCVVVGPPLMMSNTVKKLLACGAVESNIWVSFERHMKCGVGKCGHCRIGEKYICTDGPVFNYQEAKGLWD